METYTTIQAAKILQVHERTLRRWLQRGEMTGAETTAGWRLTNEDLQAWLNKHRNVRQNQHEDDSDRAALALADTSDFEDWNAVKARNGL